MERPLESLPDDPEKLKALLVERQQALSEKEQELAQRNDALARTTHEIEILKSKLSWFEEQLQLARHKRFGASSEKHPSQQALFNEAEALVDHRFLPTRVSYKLNLKGPGVFVYSACSTSLVAVHEACRSLADHQCDMALAGGVTPPERAMIHALRARYPQRSPPCYLARNQFINRVHGILGCLKFRRHA